MGIVYEVLGSRFEGKTKTEIIHLLAERRGRSFRAVLSFTA